MSDTERAGDRERTGAVCDSCDRDQRVGDEGWEGYEGLDYCPDCWRPCCPTCGSDDPRVCCAVLGDEPTATPHPWEEDGIGPDSPCCSDPFHEHTDRERVTDEQLEQVRELASGKQRAADYERRFDKAVGDRLQTDADALTALLHEHDALREALELLGGIHPERIGDWEMAAIADDRERQMRSFARDALNQGGPDDR